MKYILGLGALVMAATQAAWGQAGSMSVPRTIEAGAAFTIQYSGHGSAALYIAGPAQVLKRDLQPGQSVTFPAGSLYNAGHYLAILVQGASTSKESFEVVASRKPARLSFLAKPSRLAVGLHDGISGTVYVFDAYGNLITAPTAVTFQLSNSLSAAQQRTVTAEHGVAWTQMDSTAKEGSDRFVARAGEVSSTRVVQQVAGDPCRLSVTAQPAGQKLLVKTEPIRDCSGNAVPDGTIVTFTESYGGGESTAEVPVKHGVAEVEMPAHRGATLSVASGVVMGNELRWEK